MLYYETKKPIFTDLFLNFWKNNQASIPFILQSDDNETYWLALETGSFVPLIQICVAHSSLSRRDLDSNYASIFQLPEVYLDQPITWIAEFVGILFLYLFL